MRKVLSGLALVALVATAAQAKPGGGGGNGGGHGNGGGGNPHAEMGGGPGGGGNGGGHGHGGGGGGNPHAMMGGQGGGHGGGGKEARGPHGPDRAQGQAQRAMRQQQAREVRRVEPRQERGERKAERQVERDARHEQRDFERAAVRANGNRRDLVEAPSTRFSGRGRALVEGCPPGLAKKGNGCMPPGQAAKNGVHAASAFTAAAGASIIANSFTPSWFGYDDFGPDYRYYDGYLLRTNGDNVIGYVPLLGGALAPGRPWLASFQPEPIPDYWSDYYDLGPVDRYRYYDDVLYQLDPGGSEIEDIVALMAGDSWAVGQPMPYGYDVYNVPYTYRTRYIDGPEHWYRYADGYVYDIDPTTRLVSAIVQLLT